MNLGGPLMTPEHKFELLKTIVAVVPATIISVWALISQRRQVKPRLEVLLSPIFWRTIEGKPALGDDWPGIVVRNQSAFPLRVCNVGLKIDKKYYQFGKPLLNRDSQLHESQWPYEVAPRARAAFYLNHSTDDGHRFTKDIPSKPKDRLTWETARGYAITECGREFVSKRLSRKSLQMFHAQTER
jgi:hypothetical protein